MDTTWNGSIFVPRYARERRPNGLTPPSPPAEARQRRRGLVERALRSLASYTGLLEYEGYRGRVDDLIRAIRLGTPGSMTGGMSSMSGVATQLLGPNLPGFLNDSFTGSAGALSGHTPEVGGAWTNACLAMRIDGSGHADTVTDGWNYSRNAAAAPVNGIYTVTATLTALGNVNSQIGVSGRMTASEGISAQIQFNGFLNLWLFDGSCPPSTSAHGNAAATWTVGDTVTLHCDATNCWCTAECAVGGHIATAPFAHGPVAGECAGIHCFKSGSGASGSIDNLVAQ